jgi:hypothetical protein
MRQYPLPFALQKSAFGKSSEHIGIGVRLDLLAARQFLPQRIGF